MRQRMYACQYWTGGRVRRARPHVLRGDGIRAASFSSGAIVVNRDHIHSCTICDAHSVRAVLDGRQNNLRHEYDTGNLLDPLLNISSL